MSTDTPSELPENPDLVIKAKLVTLRAEHRQLDEEIALCDAAPTDDELLVRRLKKRKLQIKDQITSLENQLDPDEYA
ncbi:MAG: YdcH family protein [Rhodocyclaceae bacterium]|nr:YdcH family protein [Rhodocyclaceae bacterium]MBP7081747.1 YdcH family protein [Rhodocyclaceae bacterium]